MSTLTDQRRLSYVEALREGTEQEMRRDPSVILFGQGVDDHRGTVGTTLGLAEAFGPERVFDTPLSEDAMTGVAIGAAMAGLRPMHVHIRQDFLLLCMNQLVNIAAKAHYMYGGGLNVPLVVRSMIGKSWGQGAQHSQALHALFMHIPGLKVVAPSTPYDAKGALVQSLRDNNPVIFVEHRMLHFQGGHVPEELYGVPFGRARTLAAGSDVTLVGISHMAVECLRARAFLAERGISAEVIDPISLVPLDIETIRASAERTGHVVIVDNGWTSAGASAEILAQLVDGVSQPPRVSRLGFAPTTCPTTRSLEDLFYPNGRSIAEHVNVQLGGPATWSPREIEGDAAELEFKGPF
jgi:pyruvate/2-oxoglutarate/acetoin dehydrogenase E1 component